MNMKDKKEIYQNRELSWLKFNERVLDEAADQRVPLCERLSFLSIFQSNLDEFYMVRVGSLDVQNHVNSEHKDNKTEMTSAQQLHMILRATDKLCKKRDQIYNDVMSQIEQYGIKICMYDDLNEEEKDYLDDYFHTQIEPLLSPMIIGQKQPFPFMRNKDINAVVVLETVKGKEKIGLIPCTSNLFRRMIPVDQKKERFMLIEDVILHYVADIFANYSIKAKSLVRTIRNADIQIEGMDDEELDYRDIMEEAVKQRKKLSPVRLDLTRKLNVRVVAMLCRELKVSADRVFSYNQPLDVSFLSEIRDILRGQSQLFYPKYLPMYPEELAGGEQMTELIAKKDRFLYYPYESMKPFIEFLQQCARDPYVVSIKMTLYRMAKSSQIVEALIEAAENGKEVFTVVELQARFDEENNIEWSRKLEEAGCHVVYGVSHYKVHSKLCLVTRRCNGKLTYFTQVGTGNYNESTAKAYTDLCLMTANSKIGEDAAAVFKALALGETVGKMEHLMVAPIGLQAGLMEHIDRQIELAENGGDAYIGLKMNSMTDLDLMQKLVKASQAGVKVEMIIRGICCLRPGIAGYTENIHVISVVGRYLEHSRIFIFGKDNPEIYISSADWMTRNTLKRIEVAAPVYDEDIKKKILDIFDIYLKDNTKAKMLLPNGDYEKVSNDLPPMKAQEFFGKVTEEREKCME